MNLCEPKTVKHLFGSMPMPNTLHSYLLGRNALIGISVDMCESLSFSTRSKQELSQFSAILSDIRVATAPI